MKPGTKKNFLLRENITHKLSEYICRLDIWQLATEITKRSLEYTECIMDYSLPSDASRHGQEEEYALVYIDYNICTDFFVEYLQSWKDYNLLNVLQSISIIKTYFYT